MKENISQKPKQTNSSPLFLLTPLLLIITLPYVNPSPLDTWKREMYTEISLDNFREEPIFHQKINIEGLDYALLNAAIFYISNEKRVEAGKSPLKYEKSLEVMAWFHSKQMLKHKFFDHQNLHNPQRKRPEQRAKLAGILNPSVAENIAMQEGYFKKQTYLELADSFIEQWMNSRGHRENILSDQALELGVGVYTDGRYWYATQCFQWHKPVKIGESKDQLPQNRI